jgi:signal transduction histidine kinase
VTKTVPCNSGKRSRGEKAHENVCTGSIVKASLTADSGVTTYTSELSRSSTSAELRQTAELGPEDPSPDDELARLRARVRQLETSRTLDGQADALLSMLSHELRSPLQSLLLNVDLCLRRTREPESATAWLTDRLARQRRMAARLKMLIDTFLDVGQIAAGELHLDLVDMDLGDLVADVVHRTADELAWARCPVELELQPGLVGRWDRLQLDLVVSNLLSNAIKYGPGAPIEIAAWGTRDTAFLRVRDHGPGISLADQRRIFDKFTRLETTSRVGGFGLGLWIVRHIVGASGGEVAVASEPGDGATFTVSLPRTPGS